MGVRMTCHDCGYASAACRSHAQAEHAIRLHSCGKERARQASARRGVARRAAVDRTPKPCLHKIARHEHGTHACSVLDKCRCIPCSRANAKYEHQRVRAQAYGRWDHLVDAAPAREHVRALMAAGIGLKRIVVLSGVSQGGIWKLVYGKRGTDGVQRPSVRLHRDTAAKLLAVRADAGNLAGGAAVDATGTRRRIQALVTIGWSQSKLASRIGVEPTNLGTLLARDQVQARTARAVAALYDELWDTPAPATDHRSRISVSRSKRYAANHQWLPPMAWDEDTIDDPAHQPAAEDQDPSVDEVAVERTILGDRPAELGKAERAEVVRRLTAAGVSAREIGERLGRSSRGIERDRGAERLCVA